MDTELRSGHSVRSNPMTRGISPNMGGHALGNQHQFTNSYNPGHGYSYDPQQEHQHQSLPYYPQQYQNHPQQLLYQPYSQEHSLPYYLPENSNTNGNPSNDYINSQQRHYIANHNGNVYNQTSSPVGPNGLNGLNGSNGYFVTRQGPMGSASQTNAAASFFAAKKQNKTAIGNNGNHQLVSPDLYGSRSSSEDSERLRFNFRSIIVNAPPPMPSGFLSQIESGSDGGGKVRVVVRVASRAPLPIETGEGDHEKPTFLKVIFLYFL